MTRPIDEKIVAMKMDNSDFKRKAIETTGIFGKLRNSLSRIPGIDLSRTSRDIGDIASQTRRVDMNPLARSVQTISDRFSTLGVIGTTALVNITNRAVNAGIALQKSLTTDQIGAGFKEYEMKMGSIKTILANTAWDGTGLNEVKSALEELNKYADQTIYNYADMTQNIGKFTTAGIRLKDATMAIKGLSNLAAHSGTDAARLSGAMYQMSQAMQQPYMMLMDWRSLQNAGMGGKTVQDALLANAKAMGIHVDMSKGFNLSLEQGWLSTELFLKTMKQFSEDQSMIDSATKVRTFTQMMETLREEIGSGWAETWELVLGDFEEATVFFSGLAEVIKKPFQAATESRNDFLRALIAGNGFEHMFKSIANVIKPFSQIFKAVGDGFRLAFPPAGVDRINNIIKSFSELTKGLRLSEGAVANITTIFHGIFAIFSSVWEITKALTQAVFGLLPSFRDVGSGVLELLASVAELFIRLNESIKTGAAFEKMMDGLGVVLGIVGIGIHYVGRGLEWLAEAFKPIGSVIGISFGSKHINDTNEELTTMKDILSPIANFFKNLFDSIVNGFGWVKDKLVSFGQAIKSSLPDGQELFAGGFIAALIALTFKAVQMGWALFEVFTGWGQIGAGVTEVLESVGGALRAFSMNLWGAAILKVSIALAILAGSLYLIQNLEYEDIAQGLYALIGALTGLIGGLAVISKYNLTTNMASVATIVAMSIALFIISGALKKLENLDYTQITKGIFGIAGIMTALAGTLTIMSKFGSTAVRVSSLQILAIAASMHILISAIKKIAEIDTKDMYKGITGIGFIFTLIGGFLKATSGTKFGIGSTLGMLAISKAVDNIVKSVVEIAKIDTAVLVKGLGTITVILGAIAGFAIATGGVGLFTAGAGVLIIALALRSLVSPIEKLGLIPFDNLVKGLFGMTVALLAIASATVVMQGTIAGSVAILLIAGALNALLIPITAFSLMSWGGIFKGLVGILGVLVLTGVAAIALTPAIPVILLFGTALGLMGLGMLGAGVGMSLFGTGLLTLSTLSVGAVTTIIATISTLLTGLLSLAPKAAEFIGKLTLQIIGVLTEYTPKIVNKIAEFLIAMLQTFADRVPEFIEAGTDLIVNFIDGIAEAYPRVLKSAANLIVTYIEEMANAIENEGPRMTDAMLRLWGNIILIMIDAGVSMVNALFGWVPGVENATAAIGETAEQYISENFRSGLVAREKGDEFATGLNDSQNNVNKAGTSLAEAAQTGLASIVVDGAGSNFALGFARGIRLTISDAVTAASDLASRAAEAIRDFLDIRSPARVTEEYGRFTGQGFANGISSSEGIVEKGVNSIAGLFNQAWGWGSSLGDDANKSGKNTTEELAKGIQSSTPKVSSAARTVGKSASQKFREAMSEVKYRFDMEEIDSKQYIAEIKKIRDEYSKYPELVREANLKIKQIEEDMARESFRNSKDWIDERKYYNELSLTDELKAWQRIMNAYEEGTEERKQAEREVYRLKNDINRKLIDINEDYAKKVEDVNRRLIEGERELNAEYQTALDDRTKSLKDFVGIFDEVTTSSDVSGQKLINNLRAQVDTFADWSENISSLTSRGVDKNLIAELRELGPEAAGEIAALNTLTDGQLVEYVYLWKKKNQLARTEATKELEGLKVDVNNRIKELRRETSRELEVYKSEWIDAIREIKEGTSDEFVGLDTELSEIGNDSIQGLIDGMSSMEGPLATEARRLANIVSSTIKSALQIKSPSRVTFGLGEYIGDGLALGIADKVKKVGQSAKDLAITAKDSIHQFVEGFDTLEDNELHFKAVIDYSKIDPRKLGELRAMRVLPDTTLTSGLTRAVKNTIRQNNNRTSGTNDKSKTDGSTNNTPKQPIVIQSILNGRVIAEETFDDTNQLLNNQTNLDYVIKGV